MVAGVLLCTVLLGTAGYVLLEGWTIVEALYMTAITITTVGFMEVRPLSDLGRLFTIGVIFLGVGTVAYALGSLVEYAVATQLPDTLARRRRRRMLERMSDHYIICGFGRVGRQIAEEFSNLGAPFVVLDAEPKAIDACISEGYVCVQGDATADAALIEAGIGRAKGLLTALDSDAENMYVVLSARELRPDLFIVARADLDASEPKMRRAGANRVISPYALGGRRMAALATRPNVVQFLDVVTHSQDLELWLEEVVVEPSSPLAGLTLQEAQVRQQTGALVLAVFEPDGKMVPNPPPDMRLAVGARAIALGTRAQLRAFCDLVATGSCTLL